MTFKIDMTSLAHRHGATAARWFCAQIVAQLRADPRGAGLPEDLSEAIESLLADRAAMQQAGDELPNGDARGFAESYCDQQGERRTGRYEAAFAGFKAGLEATRALVARRTQQTIATETRYVSACERAERAERERDEARASLQPLSDVERRALVAELECQRLRTRIAEHESSRKPGLWLTTWTSDDGTIRAWSHDTEAGARETFAALCNPRKMLARVVDPASPAHVSRESGADVVERLRSVFLAAAKEADGNTVDAGLRAVLSHLAAMGEEAWPTHSEVLSTYGDAIEGTAYGIGARAVLDLFYSRLSPVIGALRATNADLEAELARAEDTLLSILTITVEEIMPALGEQIDPATRAKGEALAKSLPTIRERIAEQRKARRGS